MLAIETTSTANKRSEMEWFNSFASKQRKPGEEAEQKNHRTWNDATIRGIVSRYPDLCTIRYDWRWKSSSSGKPSNAFPLWRICRFQPSLALVQIAFAANPQALEEAGCDGGHPLHVACENRASPDVVHFLISKYPDALKQKDKCGFHPLHLACCDEQVSPELVQILVSECPESLRAEDNSGQIPLHHACTNSTSPEVISVLASACHESLKVKDRSGQLPLHRACSHQMSAEVIRVLLSKYQDAVNEKDRCGRIPLYWACNNGASHQVIRMLVSASKDSLKERDKCGQLPLHWACHDRASPEVIRIMVSEHREALKEKDQNGHIPLHCACYRGAPPAVIRMLVAEYPDSLKATDNNGWLPLHLARSRGVSLDIICLLMSSLPEGLDLVRNAKSKRWQIDPALLGAQRVKEAISGRLCAVPCVDDAAVDDITGMLQRDAFLSGITVTDGSMNSRKVQPIVEGLRVNNTLLCLELRNNRIGDAGAGLLAGALVDNKKLQVLDVQGCGVGPVGVSRLLGALKLNKCISELDLSHNPDIINASGGKTIAAGLTSITSLKRLYLFREDVGLSEAFLDFFACLMDLLHWRPKSFSPVLLNCLSSTMEQAICYYQQNLHGRIISSEPPVRWLAWHFILEQVSAAGQNNPGLVFFYVQNMLDH